MIFETNQPEPKLGYRKSCLVQSKPDLWTSFSFMHSFSGVRSRTNGANKRRNCKSHGDCSLIEGNERRQFSIWQLWGSRRSKADSDSVKTLETTDGQVYNAQIARDCLNESGNVNKTQKLSAEEVKQRWRKIQIEAKTKVDHEILACNTSWTSSKAARWSKWQRAN